MKLVPRLSSLAILAAAGIVSTATHAASIYLSPTTFAAAPGPMQFDLWMDFAASESTVGGGIDVALGNFLGGLSFTPSAYFTTTADPSFTGFGTTFADHALEIHFGSFTGLSGRNLLGTLGATLLPGMAAGGTTRIDLSINSHFGGFYGATAPFGPLAVQLAGVTISAVPEPADAWLLLAGLPLVAAVIRGRSRQAA